MNFVNDEVELFEGSLVCFLFKLVTCLQVQGSRSVEMRYQLYINIATVGGIHLKYTVNAVSGQ